MTIQELVALVGGILGILGLIYDLAIKIFGKGNAYGRLRKIIMPSLLVIVALAVGWLWGYYQRNPEIARLQQSNSDLASQLDENIRNRDKALNNLQIQRQLFAEDIDRLKGIGTKIPANRIIIYEHADYQGNRVYCDVGDYPDMYFYWMNDKVSSIKVIGNVKAIASENMNFDGKTLPIDGDIPTLVSSGWNDRISSIRVMAK